MIALELSVLGSHGMAAAEYPELVDLVVQGRLRPQDLVSNVIGLDEAPAANGGDGIALRPGRNDNHRLDQVRRPTAWALCVASATSSATAAIAAMHHPSPNDSRMLDAREPMRS